MARGERLAGAVDLRRTDTMERFAELLAEGASVSAAERELGLTRNYGHQLLGRIRRGLGWQAV